MNLTTGRIGIVIFGAIAAMALVKVSVDYLPLWHRVVLPVDEGSETTVIALFRSEDCAAYDLMIGFLNSALDQGVSVYGVVVDDRGAPQDGSELGAVNTVRFPLREDLASPVTRALVSLGYRTTPVVALVDDLGRVRLLLPPMADPAAHTGILSQLINQAIRTVAEDETL